MNWELAIEKNHGALKRILAMLVAMVGMTGRRADKSAGDSFCLPQEERHFSPARRKKVNCPPAARPTTLPRHLHRFVLRLLRPAEAATRRLIIIAAQGLTVTLPKFSSASRGRRSRCSIARTATAPASSSGPARCRNGREALMPKRSPSLSLPLLDPLKRFGVRRRYAKPSAMPQIRVLGGDPIVPLFRQPEPLPPPPPTPDDPLDAARIHRRLDAIGRALDDLPKQAMRMARWQARRDARWARERGDAEHAGQSLVEDAPSPSRPSGSPPLPHCVGARNTQAGAGARKSQAGAGARNGCQAGAPSVPPQFLAPTQWGRGGEGEARDGEGVNWEELGVTPEALALCRRAKSRPAQSTLPRRPQIPAASTASPRCGPAVRRDGAKGRTTMSTRC